MYPWPENPYYWARDGKPLLLLGGSDEDNLFNHPGLWHNLDILSECGGNYVRCTMSSRDEGNVWPYARSGDRYDLDQFNPVYWARFEQFLELTHHRGIVVQIEFWDPFDFASLPIAFHDVWPRNPFNPACNINYTAENTRLPTAWPHHPLTVQPFFHSVPTLNDDQVLLRYQQAYVRRVLDSTLPYDHVLYCLDNETGAPREWPWYWAEYIHALARSQGCHVQLTEMWDPWDLRDERHRATYERPDLFSFVDISQNNWQVGRTHYERILWLREQLKRSPGGERPMNNVKVYGRRTPSEPAEVFLSVDRFWQNIFAGCASTRFHRPDSGLGLNEIAQRVIRAARTLTERFDLFRCLPRPDLVRDEQDAHAYCLAIPGSVYVVYLAGAGDATIRTHGERYALRWLDPDTSLFGPVQPLEGGDIRLRTPPTHELGLALLTAA